MLRMIIEWFTSLWRKADEVAEEIVWDDGEYLRQKYGIAQTFAEEEEREKRWTK